MSVAAWTAVASSIVAAVSLCVAAGSFLVAWKAWRRDELAVRRDVLRRLVGNAYRLTQKWQGQEGEPFVALNEAFIVYADFPRVTSALESMRNELGRDGRLSLNLVTVVMAMADAAKVPVKSLDERFISTRLSRENPEVDARHESRAIRREDQVCTSGNPPIVT